MNSIGLSRIPNMGYADPLQGAFSFSQKSIGATIEVMKLAVHVAKGDNRPIDEAALHDLASAFLHYFEGPDVKNEAQVERQLDSWCLRERLDLDDLMRRQGIAAGVSLCGRSNVKSLGLKEAVVVALACLPTVRASSCEGMTIFSEKGDYRPGTEEPVEHFCDVMRSMTDQDLSGLKLLMDWDHQWPAGKTAAAYGPSRDLLIVYGNDVLRMKQDKVVDVSMRDTLQHELRHREVYQANTQQDGILVSEGVHPINPCASTTSGYALDECEMQMFNALRVLKSTARFDELPEDLQDLFHEWSGQLPDGLQLTFVGRKNHLPEVQSLFGKVDVSPNPEEDRLVILVPDRPSFAASARDWLAKNLGLGAEPKKEALTREQVLWTYLNRLTGGKLGVYLTQFEKTQDRDRLAAEVDAMFVGPFGRSAAAELFQLLSPYGEPLRHEQLKRQLLVPDL